MKVSYSDVESKLLIVNAQPRAILSSPVEDAHVVSLQESQHFSTEWPIGNDELE